MPMSNVNDNELDINYKNINELTIKKNTNELIIKQSTYEVNSNKLLIGYKKYK